MAWTVTAILLWILAGAVDRATTIEIHSNGWRIELEVAGTTLSAPISIKHITAVEIRAMDSIDPPRGGRITVTSDDRVVTDERLPRHFQFPVRALVPLGDWDLDENASSGTVWRRGLAVNGPFSVKATFQGRFHHDLELVLHGVPTTSVAIRRGLINNDAFIRSENSAPLAVSSIDPTPVADFGALVATLLRAIAVASLLIALFAFVESVSRLSPKPAAARRWRTAPWGLTLAVLAFAASVWVAYDVLEGLPHLPDSVTYLLQARWLLDGHLWGQASAYQDFLDLPYTYVAGNRWLGHYPPGWPLLLSPGLAAGAPWLTAPILGGVFVILLFLTGREIDGPVTGLLAALFGVLSPMTRVIFGSMLSHAAAAALILAGVWLLLYSRRLGPWPGAALSGMFLGFAFGIRPLSAVAISVPLAVVVFRDLAVRRDHDSRNRSIGWTLGGAVAAAPTFAANFLISGSALTFPYSLAEKPIYAAANLPFGIRNLDVFLYSLGNLLNGWGWPFFHGAFWAALGLAFAVIPFLLRRAKSADGLLLAIVVVVALAHLGSRGHGLHGFGPRYLFEAVAPLLLLSSRGFVELASAGPNGGGVERRSRILGSTFLVVALSVSTAALLPQRLALYRGYNGVDASLERQIVGRGIHRALVLLPPGDWRGWALAARMTTFEPDADLLFIQAAPDDPRIVDIAEDRPIYAWREEQLVAVAQQ